VLFDGYRYSLGGSKLFEIVESKAWKCPEHSEPSPNGEEIEAHPIILVAEGGTDDVENLQHLQERCDPQTSPDLLTSLLCLKSRELSAQTLHDRFRICRQHFLIGLATTPRFTQPIRKEFLIRDFYIGFFSDRFN